MHACKSTDKTHVTKALQMQDILTPDGTGQYAQWIPLAKCIQEKGLVFYAQFLWRLQSAEKEVRAFLCPRRTRKRTPSDESERDMEILGEQLAQGRRAGDVLFLHGDLGCGKTCLARGFVRAHTQKQQLTVTSPTYLLVNTYDEAADVPVVYHVDLYRLDTVMEQDAAALGLAEAFGKGITLIEWPERLDEASIPAERLEVRIAYVEEDSESRHVKLQPIGERWTKLFAK